MIGRWGLLSRDLGYTRTVIPVQRALSGAMALRTRAQDGPRVKADDLHLGNWSVPRKLLEQEHARILGQSIDLGRLSSGPVVDCRCCNINEVFLQWQSCQRIACSKSEAHTQRHPQYLPFYRCFASRTARYSG